MRYLGLLLLVLLLLSSSAGCSVLLYPAARAFGGAKESELKVSRQAFAQMKTAICSGSVVVYAPMVVNFQGSPTWDSDAAASAVEFLRSKLSPSAAPASETPDVPFEPMGSNQLRYENQRARLYAAWVGSCHPEGDHFVFSEIMRDPAGATILGGQIYVIDATGRIAYSRHYNTHWFDPASMPSVRAFLEWMLKGFLKDLKEEPAEIFPPYGVG